MTDQGKSAQPKAGNRALFLSNGTMVDPDGNGGEIIHAIAQSERDAVERERARIAETLKGTINTHEVASPDSPRRDGYLTALRDVLSILEVKP